MLCTFRNASPVVNCRNDTSKYSLASPSWIPDVCGAPGRALAAPRSQAGVLSTCTRLLSAFPRPRPSCKTHCRQTLEPRDEAGQVPSPLAPQPPASTGAGGPGMRTRCSAAGEAVPLPQESRGPSSSLLWEPDQPHPTPPAHLPLRPLTPFDPGFGGFPFSSLTHSRSEGWAPSRFPQYPTQGCP